MLSVILLQSFSSFSFVDFLTELVVLLSSTKILDSFFAYLKNINFPCN
jgi:hypothetical protein